MAGAARNTPGGQATYSDLAIEMVLMLRTVFHLVRWREGPASCYDRAMPVHLPEGYRPSPDEEFMNPFQAEYFRQKLLRSQAEAQRELEAIPRVGEEDREGDQADQAAAAANREFDIVSRERTEALLHQIGQALIRLDNGTYGYCDDTGDPIDLRRLEAQPTATLTTEAQARRENSGS